MTTLDKDVTPTAIDLRRSHAVRAGALGWKSCDVVSGWHHHDYHQIEYALTGVAEVETAAGRYLLPPQQAIWIPAGLAHNTTLRGVESISVFFDPTCFGAAFSSTARVLAAAPVLREMMRYALRWPISRPGDFVDLDERSADVFFAALAGVVDDLLDRSEPLWLPTSEDPVVAAAIDHIDRCIADATLSSAAAASAVSTRTLRRRFPAATGLRFSDYLLMARGLRAMSELASTGRSVIDIAVGVGFESTSGFNRAFKQFAGRTPSDYRRFTRDGW